MIYLGIFWYDERRKQLCGITKQPEMSIQPDFMGKRTIGVLHMNTWGEFRNRYYNQYAEYVSDEQYPNEETNPFAGLDYTQVPRGRVDSTNDGYDIMVGKWFFDSPDQELIRRLVLDEFNLIGDETDFVYDYHWDIGQGWGE